MLEGTTKEHYFHFMDAFHYFIKAEVLTEIFVNDTKNFQRENKTCFFQLILRNLRLLYFNEAFTQRAVHIEVDSFLEIENYIERELHQVQLLKRYLKELDCLDIPTHQRVIKIFLAEFKIIYGNLNKKYYRDKSFFFLPIHRAFSFYINRLIGKLYLIKKAQTPDASNFDLLKKIKRDLFQMDDLSEITIITLKPLVRCIGFISEIMSNKWVTSGMRMKVITEDYYKFIKYFYLLDLGLAQSLILLDGGTTFLQSLNTDFTFDGWLSTFGEQMALGKLDLAKLELLDHFDLKKMQNLYSEKLKYVIKLCSSSIAFNYSIKSFSKCFEHESDHLIKEQILLSYKSEIKKYIVHRLFLKGGVASYTKLKKWIFEQGFASKAFEEVVQEISNIIKDSKGKPRIQLKDTNVSWIDPYNYIKPNQFAKCLIILSQKLANSEQRSTCFGDFEMNYENKLPFNRMICSNLCQGSLISELGAIINIWVKGNERSESEKALITDDHLEQAVKILTCLANGFEGLDFIGRSMVVQTLRENEWRILRNLSTLRSSQENLKYSKPLAFILKMVNKSFQNELKQANFEIEDYKNLQDEESKQIHQQQKLADLKEAAKKKKEMLFNKFKSKRQEQLAKQMSEELLLRRQSTIESTNDDQGNNINCSFCKEQLILKDYQNNPFGQLAFLTSSSLLHQASNQTMKTQMENLFNIQLKSEQQRNLLLEKEKSAKDYIFMQILNNKIKNKSLAITKCNHHAHQSCLQAYIDQAKGDQQKMNIELKVGLNMYPSESLREFQCPLCKHLSNHLIPAEIGPCLGVEEDGYSKASLFQDNYLAKFISQQWQASQMTQICRIFSSRLQLINLKGLSDFIQEEKSSCGLQTYTQLLQLMNQKFEKDNIYQHSKLDQFKIKTLLFTQMENNAQESAFESFFENDLSVNFINLIVLSSFLYYNQPDSLRFATLTIMRCIYGAVQVQSILKVIYIKNRGVFQFSAMEFLRQFNLAGVSEEIKNDKQLKELYESYQLNFLRKAFALYCLVQAQLKPSLSEKSELEDMIQLLVSLEDGRDKDYLILQKYLERLMFTEVNTVKQSEEFLENLLQDLNSPYKLDKLVQNFVIQQIKKKQIDIGKTKNLSVQQLLEECQPITFEIPMNFYLNTHTFSFSFFALPICFYDFYCENTQSFCQNCNKNFTLRAFCLLCGEVMCVNSNDCSKINKGGINWHAKFVEGGSCIFIIVSDGTVLLIDQGRLVEIQSVYVSPLGEPFHCQDKDWRKFKLNKEFGGQQVLDELRNQYVRFELQDAIVKQRIELEFPINLLDE